MAGTCTAEVQYTPAQDFYGNDGFTYTIDDGTSHTPLPSADVQISVTPVNDAPSTSDVSASTIEDSPVNVALSAADVDGPYPLSFTVGTTPLHGTLAQVGNPNCSGGTCTVSMTYTPAPHYFGGDSFTFTASDGTLTSTPSTASLTVNIGSSAPVSSSVTLTATPTPPNSSTPPTVPAGAAEVPFTSVSPAQIVGSGGGASSTPLTSTPLANTPLTNTPLTSTPLANTPLTNTPLTSTGLTTILPTDPAWAQLQATPLSTLPIIGGWKPILQGTPLAARVLENVTLADVVSDATARGRLAAVPLREIDFSLSPLGDLTALEAAIGQLPLSSITVPGTTWCALLAASPVSCTDATSAQLGSRTVLSVALQGAPLTNTPLANVPLANTPLANTGLTTVPLTNTPLTNTPLANTPLTSTGLTSIPLANTPLTNVPLTSTPLTSTPLTSTPLTSTPLANTPLTSTPLTNVPLTSTPLANTPLTSTTLTNVPLTSTPLANVPLTSVARPADILTCGTGCPAGATLGSLNGLLKPGLTYGSLLAALDVTTVIPFYDLCRALGLKYGGLLASLDNGALSTITLEQLLRSDSSFIGSTGMNVLQLLQSLDLTKVTLADFVTIVFQTGAFDWESLDLSVVHPQALDGVKGGLVTYDADITLSPKNGPTGVLSTATATPALPTDFSYIRGTATLTPIVNGAPDAAARISLADPAAPAPPSWAVKLKVGTTYRLRFNARPGVTLGSRSATFTVTPTVAGSTPASSSAAVVVVGDTFEDNDAFTATGGGSGAINPDSFFLSFIRAPGDVDYFTYTIPKGTPEGTRVSFHLSHLPADYDLVVYGPSDPLHSVDPWAAPLDGQPLADSTSSLTHLQDTLGTQTLDDVVLADPIPAGETVMGVSTNRGTGADDVNVVSQGQEETYTVQVSGFNGASNDKPYMLRVATKQPPALTCTPILTGTPAYANSIAIPATPAPDVNTLFVVNTDQLRRAYPGTGAGTGAATLTTLANDLPGFAAKGSPGAILQVDAVPAVQTAYTAWNACPASAAAANNVVAAINGAIDAFRVDHSSVQNVVLVGGDNVVPFARLDDLTSVANEAGYDNSVVGSSYLAWGARAGKMLSDDPYASSAPLPYFGRQLHVRDLAVGRLVELPAQISAQLDAFANSSNGRLNPTTALTTGYDFLSDGAKAVSSSLATWPGITNRTVISDTWNLVRDRQHGQLVPATGGR